MSSTIQGGRSTIQGGPPLHPPALAFAQSLSYHSVSEAVCLPMVCRTSDIYLNSCMLTGERAIQGGCNPSSALLNA